ncbi:uncharacterized protein B0H18DRAFT_970925 [Fomitopsis serialis]|uniref:uncharacterized protein n=1 Tax=Fomitopsis serialis TaxID=139415 RepID=UPI0020078539|nr:uncharacterized protein B0H18DRAFT_970925 [Neoantrodia serialis]KAH9937502.1 hypothetical protein B0H18DRAFT_970925 [Neoantrodia serialis]
MLFDPETANILKPWLVRSLEPICDAEPGALGDYILALLKHNAPENEMRKELAGQLEEFLEKDAVMASAGPIPPERGRKRSFEGDDRDPRPPAKGPRLDRDGQFSRHGRNDAHRSSWGGQSARMGLTGRGDFMDGGMGMGNGPMGMQNGHGRYQPPGAMKGVCRDYYNNGYCARGAFCKYSHGEDAVIPSQLFPMNGGVPFMPMMANGMGNVAGAPNAAYDPHERMDMRPMQGAGPSTGNRPMYPRAPMIPREGDGSNHIARKPGELPVIQDLTPHRPQDDRPQLPRDQVPRAEPIMQDSNTPSVNPMNGPSAPNGVNGMMAGPQDVDMAGPSIPYQPTGMRGSRGGRGGGGRGGHGIFGGDAQSFRPERRNDKTLVVEKIPEDKLSLGSVNEWFKRFGTVTNVAVDAVSAKALVTFSNHDQALAAWKSEDAVFGNRFVKVFWHRPMGAHGQAGQRALAASAPLVANLAVKDASPAASASASTEASTSQPVPSTSTRARKPSTAPSAAAALAAKQKLLEQQIAEQKSLMAQLSTTSGEEKKTIMTRLRKLGEEMKPSSSTPQTPPPTSSTPPAPAIKKARSATPSVEDKLRLERERLDKELELHAVAATDGEGEENTEELKAMLAKLKAEAASLGLSDAAEGTYPSSTHRPYRGRARGRVLRGGYRGAMRGGPPRGSMKLDLRPKKLLLKGISGDNVQAVRDWYEPGGQVESVDTTDDGDTIVGFKSRMAAEQALSKGTSISTIGQVQISWYQTQQPSAGLAKPVPALPETPSGVEDKNPIEDRPASPSSPDDSHMHEEMGAAGWGGDDAEDGFGML